MSSHFVEMTTFFKSVVNFAAELFTKIYFRFFESKSFFESFDENDYIYDQYHDESFQLILFGVKK